jgi:hypothetical protein
MLSLRPLVAGDAAWLDGWLSPVSASVGYDEVVGEHPGAILLAAAAADARLRSRIIQLDGIDAGLVVYRMDAPRTGAAIIELVATPPQQARRGSGMGAAAVIEEEVGAAGVSIVYAPAPAMHGIATYFWIRLGYRPLSRAEWPCERAGVGWLARDL